MPPTKAWKAAERKVAAFFNTLRQRLSGSSGRDDETASDSKHPRLFIETKYRSKTWVRTLFDATAKLAKKEDKIPIVCVVDKGRPGFILCMHSDHLGDVAAEILIAIEEGADAVEKAEADL